MKRNLLLLLFAFLSVNLAKAQTLDQFWTPESLISITFGNEDRIGQSFMAGLTGNLTQINLGVGDASLGAVFPSQIQIEIFEGIGSSGTLLNTTIYTINSPSFTSNYAEIMIPVSGSVNVVAGNSYTIGIKQIAGTIAFRIGTSGFYGDFFTNDVEDHNLDLWFKTFVNVTAPTDIALSVTSINENVAANTIVGALTTTDADAGNTHAYSLVGGIGSTDNVAFSIDGANLRINASPDYETKNSYAVLIKTTDQGGLFYEKQFTITINDLDESPRGCWKKVSTGGYHTLAIAQDGTLWSWGDNDFMQLGNGVAGDKTNPTQVSNVGNWASVAAGEYYSLAIKTDGTLWAWGRNDFGQLGNTTTTQQNIPVQIGTATNWKTISAGYSHSIATKTDGTLWAWGRNNFGQVGNGTIVQQNTPVQIGTDTNWSSVKLGRNHTLALKTNGQLWAWGRATFGQLGTGNTTQQNAPIQIGTATDWSEIQAGENNGLAIKTTGTLWSWGDNISGQLGTGNTTQQNAPVQIGTDTNWSKIAAGSFNGYAIKTTETLWAWGDNSFGQVGNGNFTQQNSPVQVGTATDWYSITAGNYFGISQKTAGNFMSWGDNQGGQLGNGSTTPNTTGVNTPGNMGCSANVLVFDGVDDKVTIPHTGTSVLGDNSANNGSYTITTVAKLNNNAETVILDKSGTSAGNLTGFSLTTNSTGHAVFSQGMSNNTNTTVTSANPLPVNVNFSLSITYDNLSNNMSLFINGFLSDIANATGVPVSNVSQTVIGASSDGSTVPYPSLGGTVSHVIIQNTASTARQVAELSENLLANRNIQDANLVAEYKFNQGVANGNNAGLTTLYNEVVGGPVGTLENFALNGTTSNWSFDANALETLETNEFSIVDTIKIYPNPTTGIFTISIKEDASVKMYDMFGKLIYTNKANIGESKIDISNYQSGMYLLQVETENGSVTKKIIKE